jgi:hypothetical protein
VVLGVFAALGASGMGKEEGPVTKRRCRELVAMPAPLRMRYSFCCIRSVDE